MQPLDRDEPNGRSQWRFTVFAQDEKNNDPVGYAYVQINLKDINDNAPLFQHGAYYGNVIENGTAGMMVMTMTATDYDDLKEIYPGSHWSSSYITAISLVEIFI